jgi:hypothetical protein
MAIGWTILGISLTMKKKFYTWISAIFAITGISAILSNFIQVDVLEMIGWMGSFVFIVIMGILTVMNKE